MADSNQRKRSSAIWTAASAFSVINLFFFAHTIDFLRPVWNEIRNFIADVTHLRLDWMNIIFFFAILSGIFFLGGFVFQIRAFLRDGYANLHRAMKILMVSTVLLCDVLFGILYLNTGSMFLVPQYRYEWDMAEPWTYVAGALAFAWIFFLHLRRKAPASGKGRAAFAFIFIFSAIAGITCALFARESFSLRFGPASSCSSSRMEAVDFVNPLIGTRGGFDYGKTLPLAALPFGMTHWTAMTRESRIGNHPYKFHYTDRIIGFLGTHKPAVWMGDYGQMALMPGTGDIKASYEQRGLAFSHSDECSRPYSYSVKLRAGGGESIDVELAPTERSAIFRIHFPRVETANIVIEASRNPHYSGYVRVDSAKNEITGYNTDLDDENISPPLANFRGYFVIEFDRPIARYGAWQKDSVRDGAASISGDRIGAYAVFDARENQTLHARIGTSFISIEQARENLRKEIPAWNFDETAMNGKKIWSDRLSSIGIEGANEEQKEVFYTALYRTLLFPRIFSEYGRYYSAFDDRVHNGESYNDYSLWDTFRAEHPLLIFTAPDRVPGMITSLLQMFDEGGWMPKWPNPTYTNIMIGTHADAVIADAYVKGIRGFDAEKAYRALYKDAMTPPDGDVNKTWGDRAPWTAYEARAGLTWYRQLGYIPSTRIVESVSCTLEYAYDDFAVAQMAQALGKTDDYGMFLTRSKNYKNIYNSSTGFMAPRLEDGSWDPDRLRGFTEGDPWTYLFGVMHDVPGLIDLMGGQEKFAERLDENFQSHYVHENEPGHHYVYLYDYAAQPWKTQEKAREYATTKYRSGPGGLTGDEDCGQMSAWYIFSALGFYPVSPGSDEYAIGSPLFAKAYIRLSPSDPDKRFEIIAHNVSGENMYIQSATLNGRPLLHPFLRHGDIIAGGSLVFEMGKQPNLQWK